MAALLEELNKHLDEKHLERLAGHVDVDVRSVERGLLAGLPLLIAALAQDAERRAENLHDVVERDFDGSLLDSLKEVLERSTKAGGTLADAASGLIDGYTIDRRSVDGSGILDRLLGSHRDPVAAGLSRAAQLQATTTSNLLETLAPIVMHALGRVQRRDGLDADDLRDLLHTELGELQQSMAGSGEGGRGGFVTAASEQEALQRAEQFGRAALDTGAVRGVLMHPNA